MYFTACTCIDADGVTPILDTAWARGRIEFFNLSPDPTVRHTLWTQVIIIDQHPLNDGDQVKEDHYNGDCEIMSTTEKAFNLSKTEKPSRHGGKMGDLTDK